MRLSNDEVLKRACKNLVSLQRLEARGYLPFTEELGFGKKMNERNEKFVMDNISVGIGRYGDWECFVFLYEGGYMINYGKMSISAAIKGKIDFLKKIDDDGYELTGRPLLSYDFIEKGVKDLGKKIHKDVKSWINEQKAIKNEHKKDIYSTIKANILKMNIDHELYKMPTLKGFEDEDDLTQNIVYNEYRGWLWSD